MPKRYRPKRRVPIRRRTRVRKRKRTAFRRRIPRNLPPSGIPNAKVVRLRYGDTKTLDPGAGTVATSIFRCNSCYDPDYTGAGHQPRGFDEWSQHYQHYTVLSSKINVRFHWYGAPTHTGPAFVGVNVGDVITAHPYNPIDALEIAKTRMKVLKADDSAGKFLQNYYSAKRFFHVTNVKDNVKRLGAAMTGNPEEDAYYVVWALSPYGGDPPAIAVTVTVDYIVMLTERRQVGVS